LGAAEIDAAVKGVVGEGRALAQARAHKGQIAALGASRVFAVDAASTYSRPGPRLVEGVELLGHLLHPERVAAPAGIGFAPLAEL
jgi:iron complex transport system substrate-binding protein